MDNDFNERAIIVGIAVGAYGDDELEDSLDELARLAATAGANVVGRVSQKRRAPNPSSYIGSGKCGELADRVKSSGATVVIFDDDLSASQSANLEKAVNCPIVDRTALILDIFASHARTKEARIQVDLAQMKYYLPRLTGQWTHLERQEGAIGTRGPGETQLETDRRAVRRKIARLEKELGKISSQMEVRRAGRKGLPLVSLVGYTNAGKSTLMNALADADTLVEDQLFATLDTTIRKVNPSGKDRFLLSDTVGFIRKLPHNLVASFRSTLAEAVEANLLLHVIDVSHHRFERQMEAVYDVLQEIADADKPVVNVFNKTDRVTSTGLLGSIRRRYPGSVAVSALRGDGIDALTEVITEILDKNTVTDTIRIPLGDTELLSKVYSEARVISQEQQDGHLEIMFKTSKPKAARIRKIVQTKEYPS